MDASNYTTKRRDAIAEVEHFSRLAKAVLKGIKDQNVREPRPRPSFTISEAARLVNRSTSSIRTAEQEGRLRQQPRNDLGRRIGYSLEDLDRMREVFETRPWRKPEEGDEPCVIAVQNFKGGVGKSTLSVHLAQYLAIRGYRVLMVDADAQASSTMMFGIIPDQDLVEDDSLISALRNPNRMRSIIRKTHFHGLHLIPANLYLYNAEYEMAAVLRSKTVDVLMMLRVELAKVSADYDVIILDPPPALGMVSLSVLHAANALVVPVPPSIIDFASTSSFLDMMAATLGTLEDHNIYTDFRFINFVISKCGPKDNARDDVLGLIHDIFGRAVLESVIKQSAAVGNATSRMKSVYDISSGEGSGEAQRRCVSQFNSAGHELEKLIRSTWPSTARAE